MPTMGALSATGWTTTYAGTGTDSKGLPKPRRRSPRCGKRVSAGWRRNAGEHVCMVGSKPGIAWLDRLVDDREPLVEWGERALHRVRCQPFHVVESDPERIRDDVELRGQRHAAHQPVVGVDGDLVAEPAQQVD